MATIDGSQSTTAASRPWALQTFRALAVLIVLLILAQALLAGEWLTGHDVINIHKANGIALFALAVLQVVIVAVAGLKGSLRTMALGFTLLFLVLVIVQLELGFSGFDSANQARALHITNGVLLFGLAGFNATLAGRAARGA